MNQRLLAAIVTALVGSAIAAAPALAQQAQPVAHTTPAASAPATAPGAAQTAHTKAVPAPGSRQCIRDTGSHIPPPKGQCLPVAGNSYDQQDIQRTGATTVGGALQMLDPSVTVHGH